jgi:hypothetical protein
LQPPEQLGTFVVHVDLRERHGGKDVAGGCAVRYTPATARVQRHWHLPAVRRRSGRPIGTPRRRTRSSGRPERRSPSGSSPPPVAAQRSAVLGSTASRRKAHAIVSKRTVRHGRKRVGRFRPTGLERHEVVLADRLRKALEVRERRAVPPEPQPVKVPEIRRAFLTHETEGASAVAGQGRRQGQRSAHCISSMSEAAVAEAYSIAADGIANCRASAPPPLSGWCDAACEVGCTAGSARHTACDTQTASHATHNLVPDWARAAAHVQLDHSVPRL